MRCQLFSALRFLLSTSMSSAPKGDGAGTEVGGCFFWRYFRLRKAHAFFRPLPHELLLAADGHAPLLSLPLHSLTNLFPLSLLSLFFHSPLPLFYLSFISPSALLSLCFRPPFALFLLSIRSPFALLSLSPSSTCAKPSAVYKS
jgi:hypothetical protein